jgi:hypothetical protein
MLSTSTTTMKEAVPRTSSPAPSTPPIRELPPPVTSDGRDGGEPAPVDKRGGRVAERAEQHRAGGEQFHGVAPRKSRPSRAITPAKPVISPASCLRPGASDLISHRASTAVNNGSVAVRIPAAEELMCCSPHAVRKAGAAMSSRVTTAMGTITGRVPRNARLLAASGTRNTAPSTVRPNTTAEGGRCATVTRMNRNELPQMTEVAANNSSAFRLMVLAC